MAEPVATEPSTTIHDEISRLRLERNWTQVELAKLLGVSRPIVSLYETGKRGVPNWQRYNLARVFGVDPETLLRLPSRYDPHAPKRHPPYRGRPRRYVEMSVQIPIYLTVTVAEDVIAAAQRAGVSRNAWVAQAVKRALESEDAQ